MGEPLEVLYFDWLYAKVMLSEPPAESYSRLIRKLYDTEFVWLLSGDDNRAEDGIDLRIDFLNAAQLSGVDESSFPNGCSVLEMMLALAVRAEFQTDIHTSRWFWEFVSNLGLSDHYDDNFNQEQVEFILHNFVWRTYAYSGRGGMFPLNGAQIDQRKVEIWYQFSAYLLEKHFF